MTVIRTIIRVVRNESIPSRTPTDLAPGNHFAEVRIADEPASQEPWEPPVDDCGPWLSGLSLRRGDLYVDDRGGLGLIRGDN